MNTDFMVFDDVIREKEYKKNITSSGDTRYYSDACKTIKQYAKEQNTVYDPMTNQILYGINSNMHVTGVSDGTCNQINPLIYTPNYICGAGAAGGNRCVKDANIIENFSTNSNGNSNGNSKGNSNSFNLLENFSSNNSDSCNITHFAVILILIVLLIGALYAQNNSKYNL